MFKTVAYLDFVQIIRSYSESSFTWFLVFTTILGAAVPQTSLHVRL